MCSCGAALGSAPACAIWVPACPPSAVGCVQPMPCAQTAWIRKEARDREAGVQRVRGVGGPSPPRRGTGGFWVPNWMNWMSGMTIHTNDCTAERMVSIHCTVHCIVIPGQPISWSLSCDSGSSFFFQCCALRISSSFLCGRPPWELSLRQLALYTATTWSANPPDMPVDLRRLGCNSFQMMYRAARRGDRYTACTPRARVGAYLR